MMLLPAIVSAIYDEPEYLQFIYSAVITSIVGGAMAYTFLKAKGEEIGNSLLDEESLDFCKKMLLKEAFVKKHKKDKLYSYIL